MDASPGPPDKTSLPVPTTGAAELRMALDVELFAQGARALADARETRPRNTNRTYDPKQREWQEFCAEKGFEDGKLVYENKVIWAVGTLQDGYSEAKMMEAVRFCWQSQKKQSTESYLRTAVDFLLAHNILLRSESRLEAEFLDFFTIPLPDEGPTPCYLIIIIMDNSKMNPLGQLEYRAIIRY
ncbi:hypothetical protein K469DRAFT_611327 [Zopfia rhizophila CBS 207.26]|uniref:Ndc10 domain-containing protein n=1 Tax=Zopfia rhizophila CBS 207.26 TaxID=1314779 RepID=A0A6A6D9S4_9PEZI|nr:hypothetical protein K469DRAFT_611327 [Zopfia rhizophila CBS 207.26]